MRLIKLIIILFVLVDPVQVHSQPARIYIDGAFEDWSHLDALYTDPAGDAPVGNVDLGSIWMANDETFLFIRIEFGTDILIQEANEVVLYMDTDDNSATGQHVRGIGAELTWHLGSRTGVFTQGSVSTTIRHNAIGIVTAPTVSSTVFEMAMDRGAFIDEGQLLFTGDTIRLVIEDNAGGDHVPDADGGIVYTYGDAQSLEPLAPVSMQKENDQDVRMLSYNVQRDALFDVSRREAFTRLLRAVNPEIIGFQEVSGHSAADTRALVEDMLPSVSGQSWHARKVNPDLVIVSRFPVKQSFVIPGGRQGDANAAFLVDMTTRWGTDLLLLVAHPPCCRNDEDRQLDLDGMMAFMRDAQTAGGVLSLDDRTPIVILGDMNLVGSSAQLETLVTGSIVNTNLHGPAFQPDWDGTALSDLIPPHVALPMTYTWYNENSAFHPGRLDFIVYTDSVLEPGSHYVLFTPAMSSELLTEYGLYAGDATFASDHLPVVGDFRYVSSQGTPIEYPKREQGREPFSLSENYPNPFTESTTIEVELPRSEYVHVAVFDALGREVATLSDSVVPAGRHTLTWEVQSAPMGIYLCRLEVGQRRISRVFHVVR